VSTVPTQFRLTNSERNVLKHLGDGDTTKGLRKLMDQIEGAYIYKGKKYSVQRLVKFKHPESRQWIEAVEYCDWDVLQTYVREKKEFLERFKKWYPDEALRKRVEDDGVVYEED
jgi:hypothetical protein